MQIFDNKSKKSDCILVERVASEEISSSSSKWKIGSDKLFVRCLNRDRKNKLEETMKNYLDLFIYSSLNQISIRSHLVSNPNNKLISNSEQFFYSMDLWLITCGVILPANP